MTDKTVIMGISGGIAAYKCCDIVSGLRKLDYGVKVIMTKNALEFITPLTLETLSSNQVVTDMFAPKKKYDVEHISLAKEGDLFLVAPATANIIGKLANGIADDMLSTTYLANKATKVICPAMNTAMYNKKEFLTNLDKLKKEGAVIIEPGEGRLACGDEGKGRMQDPAEIIKAVDEILTPKPDYRNKTVLITAGATKEYIDPVRFITNNSSGKMGVNLAKAVIERGGKVILVAGAMSVQPPKMIRLINVETTADMYKAVMDNMPQADIIIKAAAPSDYAVEKMSEKKIKADTLLISLKKNIDIAKRAGQLKENKKLVIFAAETNDLIENAEKKLKEKNADMIVANDITKEGAGFQTDTNIATIIKKDGKVISLEKMTKRKLSDIILDNILK
ncbi:MAG: bifunctional phosphopantothenoylcysteine decarboxylase/phosphopantothenate--cysteine ligase CoaBC [Bacillota bacterium]